MKLPEIHCPEPPDWRVRWDAISDDFARIRTMQDCPQDAVFHAEGDVWTHVGMVLEALAADEEFRSLDTTDRYVLFAAALLHDVANQRARERKMAGSLLEVIRNAAVSWLGESCGNWTWILEFESRSVRWCDTTRRRFT